VTPQSGGKKEKQAQWQRHLKIATEADQSSPGATVGEAEHKMKNK